MLFLGLDLSPDVAGATLMAAASSSPELFVNILATFLTKSDVGVGTVLGTGLYALLIVPALCILLTSSKVKIHLSSARCDISTDYYIAINFLHTLK